MRKMLAKLPSPATTVAFVALLVALTGTAVALPGSNSVTGGDIRNGAVTGRDIRNNSVTDADVRNNSVRGRDIRDGSVTGRDVDESSLGAVARANTANTAQTAGGANFAGFAANAGAVDGSSIANINFRAPEDAPDTIILNQGGLRLVANCLADDIEVVAVNTTSGIGSLYLDGVQETTDNVDYEQFDQFEPGEPNSINIEYPTDTDTNITVYFSAPGGGNVTAHMHYEENAQVSPAQTGCAITGYAIVS